MWVFKNSLDFVAFDLTAKNAMLSPQNSLLGLHTHTPTHTRILT